MAKKDAAKPMPKGKGEKADDKKGMGKKGMPFGKKK